MSYDGEVTGFVGQVSHFFGVSQLYNAYVEYNEENYRDASSLFTEGALRFGLTATVLGSGYYFSDEISSTARAGIDFFASYFKEPPKPKTNWETVCDWGAWAISWVTTPVGKLFSGIAYVYDVTIGFYPLTALSNWWYGDSIRTFCTNALHSSENIEIYRDTCQSKVSNLSSDLKDKIKADSGLASKLRQVCQAASAEEFSKQKCAQPSADDLFVNNLQGVNAQCPTEEQIYGLCVDRMVSSSSYMQKVFAAGQ